MIGTIVNTCTILTGSVIGSIFKKGIKEEQQNALYTAMGLAAAGLGINAIVQNMPNSRYPVLFIVSLALGSLIGTTINIDRQFQNLTEKLSVYLRPHTERAVRGSYISVYQCYAGSGDFHGTGFYLWYRHGIVRRCSVLLAGFDLCRCAYAGEFYDWGYDDGAVYCGRLFDRQFRAVDLEYQRL